MSRGLAVFKGFGQGGHWPFPSQQLHQRHFPSAGNELCSCAQTPASLTSFPFICSFRRLFLKCSATWDQKTGKQSQNPHFQCLSYSCRSFWLSFKNVTGFKPLPSTNSPLMVVWDLVPLWPLQTSRAFIPNVLGIINYTWHRLHAWLVSSFG